MLPSGLGLVGTAFAARLEPIVAQLQDLVLERPLAEPLAPNFDYAGGLGAQDLGAARLENFV